MPDSPCVATATDELFIPASDVSFRSHQGSFELSNVANVGERTPALRTARASPEQRMPGSSESSLSQPYEDARSRAYTPETGSLLDFDTPFASPVSPPRATWRPTPSPLAGDATRAEGIAAEAPHGGESSPQQWAMLENGAVGAHLLLETWCFMCGTCMQNPGV